MTSQHPLSLLERRFFEAKLRVAQKLQLTSLSDAIGLSYVAMAAERMVARGQAHMAARLLDVYLQHLVDIGRLDQETMELALRETEDGP